MSTGQAKKDNLIQLKTNENNTGNIHVNNQINSLEKSLNDVETKLNKSSGELRSKLNDLNNKETSIEESVKKTLAKIALVEVEISQLHKDINNTNASISKNVKKIESEHTDLSTKVSETYKQLGSVEKSYGTLKTKSSKITNDIKSITSSVESLSDEIRQQIINLETQIKSVDSESKKSVQQLNQGQDELIEKTNSIVSDAKKTAVALEKSIQENASLLTTIETKLVAEIESLATSTDEKTSQLTNDIDKANKDIKSQNAKMLKLQSVDEALEKRALALEDTAKSLSIETQSLLKATDKLDNRSTALEDTVETLEIQVYRIEEENEIQQAQLDLLKEKTSKTNQTLAALSRLVSVNFVTTGAFLTLLVVSVIALYLYQDNLWSEKSISSAQRTNIVNQQINGLTERVITSDDIATDRIAQLENQVASLNQQLKTVNDKNVSLDNRLVNIAPHRTIGNDNMLHSQQWINQQPITNYAIHILTANSEAELFELAVRYNHNLNDVLSFKTILTNDTVNYVLFMGNYADEASATVALKDLPFRLNGQEPELTTFEKMI